MSPRNLKRVLQTLRPLQEKSIQDMGFKDFLNGNFDFYYTPSKLGMWVIRNFDPKSCTITMEVGRRIKITQGIPMGDIKVESQKAKNLSDTVIAKWRKSIIYVNSTVSETIKVEKTVPAFKAWNSKLLLKREQEEIELGEEMEFYVDVVTEDVDATEDVLDKNEDFKSLDFEEMKNILRQNLVKCNKLMVDTDYKLKIALSFNPEDKELKKMIEERNNVFLDFFKVEDNNENLEGEEIDGDKNRNTNENPLEKGHNEEIGSEEVEGIKINVKKKKGMKNNRKHMENQMKMKVRMKQTITNLRALTILETFESIVNVVDVLPQICVRAKGSGTLDVATKKQVEVEKSKVLKEKRTVKPSSNFYDRRIKISEPLSEEEKKLVEYIWSDSCPEGDIVFARKRLELECLWFLSLYPEIKVDATVIDALSDVLNHEEKYRRNLLITSHVYCWTEMLPPYLVEDKNQVNERRRIFDENVAMILENSKKKLFQ
ncbi:hypothetical protein Tco_1232572 [Tanacetum coccineum]